MNDSSKQSAVFDHDICIVGAGAAGLWAAGVAARRGARVLVLEKTARTGT
ncbi:MAG: flavin-dependent dehydrogenase, partial [Planctomycetota bacterium]